MVNEQKLSSHSLQLPNMLQLFFGRVDQHEVITIDLVVHEGKASALQQYLSTLLIAPDLRKIYRLS